MYAVHVRVMDGQRSVGGSLPVRSPHDDFIEGQRGKSVSVAPQLWSRRGERAWNCRGVLWDRTTLGAPAQTRLFFFCRFCVLGSVLEVAASG